METGREPNAQLQLLSPAARQTYIEQLMRFRLSQILDLAPAEIKVSNYNAKGQSAILEIPGIVCHGKLLDHKTVRFTYIPSNFTGPITGRTLNCGWRGFGAPRLDRSPDFRFSNRKELGTLIAYEERVAQHAPGKESHMLSLIAVFTLCVLPLFILPWVAISNDWSDLHTVWDALCASVFSVLIAGVFATIFFNIKEPFNVLKKLFNAPSVYDLQHKEASSTDDLLEVPCTLGDEQFRAHLEKLQKEMGHCANSSCQRLNGRGR